MLAKQEQLLNVIQFQIHGVEAIKFVLEMYFKHFSDLYKALTSVTG